MAVTIHEIEKRSTYVYVRLSGMSYVDRDRDRILQWCKERQCGKMVNNYAISFKNEDELTMFRLTWC